MCTLRRPMFRGDTFTGVVSVLATVGVFMFVVEIDRDCQSLLVCVVIYSSLFCVCGLTIVCFCCVCVLTVRFF